jgi:hypothetical protein
MEDCGLWIGKMGGGKVLESGTLWDFLRHGAGAEASRGFDFWKNRDGAVAARDFWLCFALGLGMVQVGTVWRAWFGWGASTGERARWPLYELKIA